MVLQVTDMVVILQRRVISWVVEAIVTEKARMPFIREDRDKLVLAIRFGSEPLYFRPVVLENLEAVDPFHVRVIRHRWHVMPLGMRRESQDVQMLLRDVVRPLNRPARISDRVVIMKIAPEELVVVHRSKPPVEKVPLHSSGDASRLNCVAPRSNMSNMLPRRALPAERLAVLGATRDFTTDDQSSATLSCRPRVRDGLPGWVYGLAEKRVFGSRYHCREAVREPRRLSSCGAWTTP